MTRTAAPKSSGGSAPSASAAAAGGSSAAGPPRFPRPITAAQIKEIASRTLARHGSGDAAATSAAEGAPASAAEAAVGARAAAPSEPKVLAQVSLASITGVEPSRAPSSDAVRPAVPLAFAPAPAAPAVSRAPSKFDELLDSW